jgi:hypothetical protein
MITVPLKESGYYQFINKFLKYDLHHLQMPTPLALCLWCVRVCVLDRRRRWYYCRCLKMFAKPAKKLNYFFQTMTRDSCPGQVPTLLKTLFFVTFAATE